MGKLSNAVFCATFFCMSPSWADTLALAIPAPLSAADTSLLSLPDAHPIRFTSEAARPTSSTVSLSRATVDAQADANAFGIPCAETLQVKPMQDALLSVTISAPCRPEEKVQVSYAAVVFDVSLSMTGEVTFEMPAMAYHAEIDSIFDDYSLVSTKVVAPELKDFVRVALAWDGVTKAQLKGEAPRHLPINVITLGDGSGRTVDVLSHHIDPDARSGVIRLSMVAAVTDQNCGVPRKGHVVQHMPEVPELRYDLVLAVAGCDRVGTNLELKNILQDLKLASN